MSERDRLEAQIRAGVRRNGKTFDAALREAFEAGRQHALSTELDGVGDTPAPDFDEWRQRQLP